MKFLQFFISFFIISSILAEEDQKDKGPPKIGNFSLPQSQQPSGLFAFGGNILDKGEVQTCFFSDIFRGKKRATSDLIPAIIYGIKDNFSLLVAAPFCPIARTENHFSQGIEDCFTQFEYAFFNKDYSYYTQQATVVANISFPTGSTYEDPNTGFGSPSFFIGGTYYKMYPDWFYFFGPGVILTTSYKGTKIGNQYLYQGGFGKNFAAPKNWVYAWMVELDGQYYEKNKMPGNKDKNSGGHILFLNPSLWLSNKNLYIQFGFSLPLTQHFFGKQGRLNYGLNFNIAWSFYADKK